MSAKTKRLSQIEELQQGIQHSTFMLESSKSGLIKMLGLASAEIDKGNVKIAADYLIGIIKNLIPDDRD